MQICNKIQITNNQANRMQIVTDPENYQTSQIVQKSSKSGIFSNKRLLVIKNGFLYYFTNVPKNYKDHVPNILSTFKELPKSSIQIKTIQQIKMESSNSTNLIIKFYEKDMIEREDIRKSINDNTYRHTKKQGEELQQWKFTYAKVLNCRLWYTALLKLKAYFSKQEDKIQEFFKNFDPVKRNSHIPSSPTSMSGKNYRASSEMSSIVSQFKEQDKKKQKQISLPISLQPGSVSPKKQPQPQQIQSLSTSLVAMPQLKLQTINEDQEIRNKKMQDQYREQIQEQVRLQEQKKNQKVIGSMKSQLQAKNQKIKILQQAIKATDKLRIKEEQAREKERQKEKLRQIQMEKELQREKQKQRKILEQQNNKMTRVPSNPPPIISVSPSITPIVQLPPPVELPKQTPSSSLSESEPFCRTVQLAQFSVQTDGSQQQDDDNQNEKWAKNRNTYKRRTNNQSYLSGLGSTTQRDTYTLFQNAGSMSFQLQNHDHSYENYDYYTEIQEVSNTNIKFQQRIKKQIRLINYVTKIKSLAVDTFKQYIDSNKPTKSIKFMGTLFEITIVCASGKIINVNNVQKLVYSNQQHQSIKREFKLYAHLQDKIIQYNEKRRRCPVRVPLCYYVEYKGYTGLLKYVPYLKKIQDQTEIERVSKVVNKLVGDDHSSEFNMFHIANRQASLYMIMLTQHASESVYKITKQPQKAQIDLNSNQLYGPKLFTDCRNKFISTNSDILQKQIVKLKKDKQDGKTDVIDVDNKIMAINQILLCRGLKKLYRSLLPFAFDQNTNSYKITDFIREFLASPQQVKSLIDDKNQVVINGLLISYFQHFIGLCVPQQFNIYDSNLQQCSFQYQALIRQFPLSSLYPMKLLNNLQSYISSQKLQLTQTSFSILSQLSPQISPLFSYNITILSTKHKLKHSNFHSTPQQLQQLLHSLQNIRMQVSKFSQNIWMECYMLEIQIVNKMCKYQQGLQLVNQVLQYVEYMVGTNCGQLQDCLYLLVGQMLAKMGRFDHSIHVYTNLLSNKQSTLTQHQIALSIADVFCNFGDVDASTLIQFLLSLISSKQDLSSSQVKQSQQYQNKSHQNIWVSKIKMQVGLLYCRLSNTDLSIKYLQQSLQYYDKYGISQQQQVTSIIQICLTLFSSYQRASDRALIFAKLINLVQINSQSQKFSRHIVRMVRAFVTQVFCAQVQSLDSTKRNILAQVLQQLRDDGNFMPQFVHAVTLQDVDRTIEKLNQRGQLGYKQAKVLQLVDISEVQTFLLALE